MQKELCDVNINNYNNSALYKFISDSDINIPTIFQHLCKILHNSKNNNLFFISNKGVKCMHLSKSYTLADTNDIGLIKQIIRFFKVIRKYNKDNSFTTNILSECILQPTDLYFLLIQAESLQILEKVFTAKKKQSDVWSIKTYYDYNKSKNIQTSRMQISRKWSGKKKLHNNKQHMAIQPIILD